MGGDLGNRDAPRPWNCRAAAALIAAFLSLLTGARAHPVPFSFLDIRLESRTVNVSLVIHTFDAAHEVGVSPPERLLDPAILAQHAGAITELTRTRIQFYADGEPFPGGYWRGPEPLPERQSLRLNARFDLSTTPGRLAVNALLFPYDPEHRTFINFYERDEIASQVILDRSLQRFEYSAGTKQGIGMVIQRFLPAGVHHILVGPDHLLFLIGLLLLGGPASRLLLVVTAFTLGHSITLALAALDIFSPPAQIVEPAIALSIVYVGADNLLVGEGRDTRAWIALAFGLIHGFGFAGVLREMGLAGETLGWSLAAFNLGVELGQLLVVLVVAWALAALRRRSQIAGRRFALAGSIVVIAAGAFWFIERVFFPGGMA